MSERFAALNAIVTSGAGFLPLFFYMCRENLPYSISFFTSERNLSMNIRFYEINAQYIDYLSSLESHFFHNKRPHQQNERKYIGIVLQVNGMDYFAPLSSFKPKHAKMNERVDFIKIKNYAVININNMFPVPVGLYTYVNIQKIKNGRYRVLLQAEYRIIKKMRERILKNAEFVYDHRIEKGASTPLGKRCHDFQSLENACRNFHR